MLCLSLEAEPGSAPRLHYCFLAAPPLSLHPLPSLISNYLSLPFRTQGRSWSPESVPYKNEEQGSQKGFCPWEPHRSCSGSFSLYFFLLSSFFLSFLPSFLSSIMRMLELNHISSFPLKQDSYDLQSIRQECQGGEHMTAA